MAKTKRARRLRRNALGTKQKLLVVGGLAVVGGVAAYALSGVSGTGGGGSSGGGSGTQTNAGAALADQCAQLQQQLVTMRLSTNPDQAALARLESQVATCIQQARAAGGDVDHATSDLSDGDSKFQQIESWFSEYKGTDYSDALKRNNIRKNMLDTGASMAASYAAAVTAATDPTTTRAARLSILRALDSAVVRRLCYLYVQAGCDRFGLNEDDSNTKAAAEMSRVVQPLLDAHGAAVQKLWSTGGQTTDDNALYFATLMKQCQAASDYATAKFGEYKATDYSDAVKRNNVRQDILTAGRTVAACLQSVVDEAIAYSYLPGLRLAYQLLITALDSAITRWLCYYTVQPGCDRFGVNEDFSGDKAGQESVATIVPLTATGIQAATKLVWWGDGTSFEPLVKTKNKACVGLQSYLDAKFGEYKATDYSDAIKRNNLRQVTLQTGGIMATLLQENANIAIQGAPARPGLLATRVLASGAMSSLLKNSGLNLLFTPSTGTSGLGASLATTVTPLTLKSIQSSSPVIAQLKTAINIQPTPQATTTTTPSTSTTDAAVQASIDAGVRMVQLVLQAAKTSLDSAINRQLCYLYSQSGCSRFGVNEDDDASKANQEYATTVAPIMRTVAQLSAWLVAQGNTTGESGLVLSKLLYCNTARDYINAKFAEYKAVDWSDAVRRNNLRNNEINGRGASMVQCYQGVQPTTAAGRALVKAAVDVAIQQSQGRVNCYNDSSSQCGRFGWNEDDNGTKAAQETSIMLTPLTALSQQLAAGGVSGLGQALDSGTWFNLGAAAFVGGLLIVSASAYQKKSRPNARRRRKRTSRRAR